MDKEALDHSIVHRLLDHLANHSTDMSDERYEVPAEVYASRSHYEQEIEVLFKGQPIVLCLSGALPRPGSFWTVELCRIPVLITRDEQGKAHAFANICRHRGVRVVDGAGQARRFTCPFHAWVYDLEGKLVGVPVPTGFEGMCREEKGLVELPVAEGYGLIVGRLRPGDPVDIDGYLGPGLTDELATLDFAGWQAYKEPHVHAVKANWKVTLDTYRENYHFDRLHGKTLGEYAYGGVLTFDAFGPHLRNATAIRTIDTLRGVPEAEWGDVSPHFSYQYQLFPNTTLTFDSLHIEMWQILPVDEATSEVLHTAYLRPGLSDEDLATATELTPWICKTVVDGEDFWVAARTEPGIRTGLLDKVVFGRNELALTHLHKGFLAALSAARDQDT